MLVFSFQRKKPRYKAKKYVTFLQVYVFLKKNCKILRMTCNITNLLERQQHLNHETYSIHICSGQRCFEFESLQYLLASSSAFPDSYVDTERYLFSVQTALGRQQESATSPRSCFLHSIAYTAPACNDHPESLR